MSMKLRGKHQAVGHWSRSTFARVEADQTAAKIRVALEDKLLARGRPSWLYLPVRRADTTAVPCTCVKDTTQSADRACFSCSGVGLVPGFGRFLHETLFFSSAEIARGDADWSLARCALDTRIKPFRVLLNAGETSGVITTPWKAFSNPRAQAWASKVDGFLRGPGNAIDVLWTTDEDRWWPLTELANADLLPRDDGRIRLQITMARTAATANSPAFEIVRLRHAQKERISRRILVQRPDLEHGQILFAKTWAQERLVQDASRGGAVEHGGDRAWTAPLDFWDSTLTMDTPECRIRDDENGPHPFFELAASSMAGTRYVLTGASFSEQFGQLTHQTFSERKAQPGEISYAVF